MIAFLLDIYVLVIWLVFFRFKLLKFDLKAKITSAVIGLVLVFGILIVVNFLHPQTMDARGFQHVLSIAPRLPQAGRVTEVTATPNTPLKKGDVLFKIDARPFQLEVDELTASLAGAEQQVPQLNAAYESAQAAERQAKAQLDLAKVTYDRAEKLGTALSEQERDEAKRNLEQATAGEQAAVANAQQAKISIAIGEQRIEETKAQLASAKLNLEETTVTAPENGFVTNVTLRPGYLVAPGQAVMTFIPEPEGIVVATFPQEYLGCIEPGNDAEVALDMYPGRMIRGKVDSVIWGTSQGQGTPSGTLADATTTAPRSRFGVRIQIDSDEMQRYRIPAGAGGAAAIYTNHGRAFKIVRKVVVRWYTWLNYLKISM